jgi:hypothetical protein
MARVGTLVLSAAAIVRIARAFARYGKNKIRGLNTPTVAVTTSPSSRTSDHRERMAARPNDNANGTLANIKSIDAFSGMRSGSANTHPQSDALSFRSCELLILRRDLVLKAGLEPGQSLRSRGF